MFKQRGKNNTKAALFIVCSLFFLCNLWVARAVAPGSVADPSFGPQDDTVQPKFDSFRLPIFSNQDVPDPLLPTDPSAVDCLGAQDVGKMRIHNYHDNGCEDGGDDALIYMDVCVGPLAAGAYQWRNGFPQGKMWLDCE